MTRKFKVSEKTTIVTTYVIEANSAESAVNKAKNQKNNYSPSYAIDQTFRAEEIKEEKQNDTN